MRFSGESAASAKCDYARGEVPPVARDSLPARLRARLKTHKIITPVLQAISVNVQVSTE